MREKRDFTLAELAKLTDAELIGNPDHRICGFADLESAKSDQISFLSDPKYINTRYLNACAGSLAGAIYISPRMEKPEGKNYLVCEDPSRSFQTAIEAIRGGEPQLSCFSGSHPTAVIHETAQIGTNVTIGPHAVIDGRVKIGNDCVIGAGVFIGPDTVIGDHCTIHPNVTIREFCIIGNRVIIQPSAVIGACGFGYTTDKFGKHTRLTHIGNIVIEDDVEIGANAVIDRSRFTMTKVGQGSKVDNLVDIGHNVVVGKHNLICAQSGIAGSTVTGNHVVLAGQVGVNGHIKLADGVVVAGKSGVTKSLPAGKYGGNPAIPLDQYNRQQVFIKKIESIAKQVKNLQKN